MDVLYSKVQVHTSKRQLFLLLMPAQSPVNCTLCKWKFATPEKLLEGKHFFMGLFKQSNCVTGSVISVNIISCFICFQRAKSTPQIICDVCVLCNTQQEGMNAIEKDKSSWSGMQAASLALPGRKKKQLCSGKEGATQLTENRESPTVPKHDHQSFWFLIALNQK